MKKMLKFSALLLGLALILGLTGCPTDGDDDGGGGSGLSFESTSPPSIFVENLSDKNLVAFKGSLNPNNLIGGIPSYASNYGLAKPSTLFTQTGDFALVLITEDDYVNNKSNLAAAAEFARIYAFYNNEATNNNVFQISSKSGGSGRITLNNSTPYNIEIRRNGPTGEVLGYVAANMTNTVLRVEAPEDYSLYPVFKRYNPVDKEIYSVVPKYQSGALEGKPYAKDFALTVADGTTAWNLSEVTVANTFNLSSGCFYLRIVNNAQTAVRFTRGDDEQVTSVGIKGIPPSTTNVYAVRITRGVDGKYPTQETISGLKIGTQLNPVAVADQVYKLDYTYTITVTGADASNLAVGTPAESDGPVDLEAMFNSY